MRRRFVQALIMTLLLYVAVSAHWLSEEGAAHQSNLPERQTIPARVLSFLN